MFKADVDDARDAETRTTANFHNPLFNTNQSAPKDARLYPTQEKQLLASNVSSMVMRRHGRRDGRKDGAVVDITRERSGEHKRATGARKVKLVSSVDLPACVVVKSGDAADAGEVLQHCAFRMESYRVIDKSVPNSTSFTFVFNSGTPAQSALNVTHSRRPSSAGGSCTENGGVRVRMTLGGMNVPHVPGESHSCNVRQVGIVTFNPRKQVKGRYLFILSQEGRTLFTALS